MTDHGTRQLDPRWHQLQEWTRRLYDELGPSETLCGVLLSVHDEGGLTMTYWVDTSGDVSQTVITPDGVYLTVPNAVSMPPGGSG